MTSDMLQGLINKINDRYKKHIYDAITVEDAVNNHRLGIEYECNDGHVVDIKMRSQYYTDNPVADADNYWYDKDKEWEDTLKEYRKCDICGESLGYGDTVYDIFLDRSVVICEEC